jgi:PhoPQ-activated pathogenicity-related protein
MSHTIKSDKAIRYEFHLGPAALYDMDEIQDESTLEIETIQDTLEESQARAGKRLRLIRLRFTSQNWHGFHWKHRANIYIPENYRPGGNVGIIGTSRAFYEPGNEREFIPGTDLRTESEYAEGTAIDLGIPIMIFVTPDEDLDGMDESDLMGFAMLKMLESGDLTWSGYYAIAKSYLRALTLMNSHPDIQAQKAVLLGCSKRGSAVSICTGVDPERIAGIMATCYPGGNHLNMMALKYYNYGPDIDGPFEERTGPGFQPAKLLLRAVNHPIGFGNLMAFDPYLWRDRIQAAFLVTIGTNDEFYGLGTPNEMMEHLQGDKAFLAIDNLPHTWVSQKHLAAWRMWLMHSFQGRNIPQVEMRSESTERSLNVSAKVVFDGVFDHIKLYYAYNQVNDWRFARWESQDMTRRNGEYKGLLQRKPREHLAYYVEVGHSGPGGLGYVSSLVETLRFDQ